MKRFFVFLLAACLLLAMSGFSASAEAAEAEYTAAGGNDAVLLVFICICFVSLLVLVCFYGYRKRHYNKTLGE